MKKALLSLIALLPLTASAEWNDVTEQMLQTPTFDNNSAEGWDRWTWGSSNIDYNTLENFNGWFDFSQKISAPAGRYRLSCQAYYRMGNSDDAYTAHQNKTEEILAVLYANDFSKPVPSIFDYYTQGEFTGWWGGGGWWEKDGRQYPNNMEKGSEMFNRGHYSVSLEFNHAGGDLQLGIKNNREDFTHYGSDWCMMDNFRLEYDGEIPVIPVEYFFCYSEHLDMMSGDTYTLQTYVYPANATERNNIVWSSSNEAVVTVDHNGVVTAVGNGTATITGTCDGQVVEVSVAVVTIDMTGKEWIDVTADYLRNVNMEDGFEAWNRAPSRVDYQMAEFWNTTFEFYQTLELPEGDYRFSCEGFFRPTNSPQEAVNAMGSNTHFAYIYAGTRQVPMLDITSVMLEEDPTGDGFSSVYDSNGNWYYLPNQMQAAKWCFENGYYHYSNVVFHTAGNDKVEMGLRCDDYVNGHWAIFDNFRLERLVKAVATESLTLAAAKTTLVPGETVQAQLTIKPQDATYQTVLWSSSNEAVATVDAEGLINAIAVGTTTITATARDNDRITATLDIVVKESESGDGMLLVNEVMSMNVDRFLDPSFNYGGWIELYNSSSQTISLRNCYITEDPNNLKAHRLENATTVKPHGFYTIWFDHYNTYFPKQVDFKLSTSGDWVAIVSPTGEIMAEITYPAGIQRCSWARKTDGGDEWGWTGAPTPGKTNATSTWATKQLAAPTVDVPGQLFTGELSVKASWPEGSTLYYTTDGSTPSATNGFTSDDGIFYISQTTNLRLVALQDGMLPSAVTTNTYIYKEYDFTIPVLSVTADYEDIWGADHGILVRGNGNGRSGNGQSGKCNWNQDWDHPCTFEYYMPTGERSFMQDVDICAAGGWSRAWEPHSFKLKAAKVYGLNSMDYPFFDSKPYNKHKALQIRNGGNDNGCRFKDAAIQTIVQRSGLYIDGQAYQPVVHYINGQLIGVINMREPNNKHHAYSNYGYDTDFMDQFEMSPDSGWICKNGNREAYDRLLELSENAADPEVYATICNELLDIDEYINYMAVNIWLGGSDWMRNNVKAYRSTETDGKFHYVMFDTDGSFGSSGSSCFSRLDGWYKTTVRCDYIYEKSTNLYVPFHNVDIWINLMQNDQFRKQVVDTYSLVCGSVFEPERCNEILDELYNRVQPMMQLTGSSARSTYNDLKNRLGSANLTTTNINGIANYSRFYGECGSPKNVTFSSNIPDASILYNGMDVPTGKFTGKAYLPVTLEACAPGGYDFKGWVLKGGVSEVSEALFEHDAEWSYYDQGSLDGVEWMSPDYVAGWPTGTAPLGYDDGSSANGVGSLLNTTITYGDNARQKHVTYYFRHNFMLDQAPSDGETYVLDYILDDGCIVYVNGTEVGRDNMPDGEVRFSTVSNTYAYNNPNRGTMQIPTGLLHQGDNLIAVEVHNNSLSSSDVCWAGGIYVTRPGEIADGELISTDLEFDLDNISDGAELIAYYTKHQPEGELAAQLPPVRINEVSAANETYANEYYKRNDWIELYNTTDQDIDLAGYYLSDNINKPEKYQIPTQLESGISTVIPAHGYMLIWCDKLADKSFLHASFKLAAEEACVMLMSPDHSWTDYLNYPAHDRDHTAGRYPDGSDNAYLMTTMTPGSANRMSSYTESYELGSLPEDFLTPVVPVQTCDLVMRFDGRSLLCSQMAAIEVYTTAGELLMTVPAAQTVSLSALRPGVYVARAKADGHMTTLKFRK